MCSHAIIAIVAIQVTLNLAIHCIQEQAGVQGVTLTECQVPLLLKNKDWYVVSIPMQFYSYAISIRNKAENKYLLFESVLLCKKR